MGIRQIQIQFNAMADNHNFMEIQFIIYNLNMKVTCNGHQANSIQCNWQTII